MLHNISKPIREVLIGLNYERVSKHDIYKLI
jgi:hypothetical protein